MKKCQDCRGMFPVEFFPAGGTCVMGTYLDLCPRCAAKLFGGKFSEGSIAEMLLESFEKYLTENDR